MTRDIWTMAWKEWKELFAAQGRWRGGGLNFALLLAVFGIALPWQFGHAWVTSPMMLLSWGWAPLLLLSHVVVDAVAGERERHTLETLLASRLPDRAILIGKMAAAIAYGLVITVGSLALGLLTVNLSAWGGDLLLYSPATLAGVLITTFLGAILIAALGVLVSLRAATVRQAGQIMGAAVLLVAFVPVLAVRAVLRWWHTAGQPLSATETLVLGSVVLGTLVLVAAALVASAVLRFRRSRLALA